MCSRFLKFSFLVLVFSASITWADSRELRVCSDPGDLPFSNRLEQGFENQIAKLVARNLDARLIYVWQRMGRGFVREYLDSSKCDLLIGIPANYHPVLTTIPYYRSTYVFVSRRDHPLQVTSFNSPGLHGLTIGVQALEEDYTPPAEALVRRGLQNEIRGFDTTSDPDSIVQAVADRKIDMAVVWGPLAGYFARAHKELEIFPVEPEVDPPGLPFTFAISMGVRKGNEVLRNQLNKILAEHEREIKTILDGFGVPQLPTPPYATKLTATQ